MQRISNLLPLKKCFTFVCSRDIFRANISCSSMFLVIDKQYANRYLQNSRFLSKLYWKEEKPSLIKRFKKKYYDSMSYKAKIKISGCLVYENCADNIDHSEFCRYFNLPDTFQSWFLSVGLHVWLIAIAVASAEHGRAFRNSLVESMWHDIEMKLGHLTTMKSSMKNKHLTELNSQFRAMLISYDEGILGDDIDLSASAWRSFFCFENVDPQLLEKIVLYIRKQLCHLDSLSAENITLYGSISFLPFKQILDEERQY